MSNFIPFVRKFTPSDCYTIYKKGGNVRIDLTLVGWERLRAKRGALSLLYIGEEGKLLLIDYVAKTSKELMGSVSPSQLEKYIRTIVKEQKCSGEFKLEDLEIRPAVNRRGEEIHRKFMDWTAQKFIVKFRAALHLEKRKVTQEK